MLLNIYFIFSRRETDSTWNVFGKIAGLSALFSPPEDFREKTRATLATFAEQLRNPRLAASTDGDRRADGDDRRGTLFGETEDRDFAARDGGLRIFAREIEKSGDEGVEPGTRD